MKRKIAVLVMSSMMVLGLNAQNLSFGPSAGFGGTWISGLPNSKSRAAGNVGVALTYSSAPHFGIGSELKYSIEGGNSKVGSTDIETRLDYIRVPLKLIYFFGDFGDKLRPKVAIGPSFGFLVGGNRETSNNNMVTSKTNATDLFKTLDVGIGASAGINYRLVKNTWFVADVNYYNGLTNINQTGTANNKNRNIGLNIGVNFGIGNAR